MVVYMNETEFKINPIGVVHSAISETSKMPKDGISEAKIEIFEKYLPAMHGLEKFSHIYLMCFFHKSDRSLLRIDPQKVHFRYANCEDAPLGVFSGRSPARPNPIALTVVKIKAIQGREIEVEHCDAVDGTPVVDIKPYNGGIDRFMNLSIPSNAPKKLDMKLRWVERIITNVTGSSDAAAKIIAKIFVDAFDRGYVYTDKNVWLVVSNIPRLIDSALFLADATFSSGRLMVINEKDFKITFIRGSASLKYRLAAEGGIDEIIAGKEDKNIEELFEVAETN